MSCELEATIARLRTDERARILAELGPERFAEFLPRLESAEADTLERKAAHDAAPCRRVDCTWFHCPRAILVLCPACVQATGGDYVHLPPVCADGAAQRPDRSGLRAWWLAAEQAERARRAAGGLP